MRYATMKPEEAEGELQKLKFDCVIHDDRLMSLIVGDLRIYAVKDQLVVSQAQKP